MSIVDWDPRDLEQSNVVQVDSDARENADAILEIENWAAERGFVRTNEYWLRQVVRNGKRLFRGICYRMTDEEREANTQDAKRVAEIVKSIQSGSSEEEAGPQ